VKKKKGGGGGANWMDTYGDMVTLLLCFFVMLYSMSTISEENFKALVMSFNPDSLKSITQTSGNGGPVADPLDEEGGLMEIPELSQGDVDEMMENLYESLQEMVQDNNMSESVSVTQGDGKVFVTFNQTTFFDGDSYVLRSESLPILDQVCDLLSGAVNAIDEVRILGHTAQSNPNSPNKVREDRFLASNRATNVLIYIQEHSVVDPARLVSEGLGQWRPIASNDTEEGRSQNRRVEMIISGRNLDEELDSSLQEYTTTTMSDTATEVTTGTTAEATTGTTAEATTGTTAEATTGTTAEATTGTTAEAASGTTTGTTIGTTTETTTGSG
jgi:chemotaxis protein MotB